MLDANKQDMTYALQLTRVPVYETDAEGNIQYYEDSDGNKFPIETGEYETGYTIPVAFRANIAFSGGEAQEQEYGFNVADYDATIISERNEFSFKKGDLIWLDSDVVYKTTGTVDATSADFVIVGVKPAWETCKYMLKAVVK